MQKTSKSNGYVHNLGNEKIAYFTMEVGLDSKIPTYSGGLGILAGDILKAYADIGLNAIGVSLLNEKGYFHQHIDESGWQIEEPVIWNPSEKLKKLPNTVEVEIEGRKIKLSAWQYIIKGIRGDKLPVIFLDSNNPENSDYDKTLTSFLYGGDRYYRLCQEIILGIGGVRMLNSLGHKTIKKYHMNEGHAALLTIELLKTLCTKCKEHPCKDCSSPEDLQKVKEKCVFTTHTPVAAGHDRFEIDLFKKVLGNYVPEFLYSKITQNNEINMTLLALVMSHYVNGVAKRHQDVTEEMFPEYRIDSITNGIHSKTWACESFTELYNEQIPDWALDPFTLRYVMSVPKHDIWNAHYKAKEKLIEFINKNKGLNFHTDRFTIGYARRFTAYKRPDLLIYDIERLKKIANEKGDIQIVFSGKSHPHDTQGKEIMKHIINLCKSINSENGKLKMIFLEHYDMNIAKMLVSGCDIWLNTPQRPYEASGTSGMKAAVNGVPQFSTIDGWWLEGRIEGETGWSIGAHPNEPDFEQDTDAGKDANDLYVKLNDIIIPTFYGNRKRWTEIMRHCIAINASFFNTFRVAQQYVLNAYIK